MHALQCRNGHLCFSAAERPDGSCPECGDESFSLVTVKEETVLPATQATPVTAADGSVVAIHNKRGTGYVSVAEGGGGYSEVITEAGAKYLVHTDSVEFLSGEE